MGDKRRAIFAAAKFEGATDIAVGSIRLRPRSRERTQACGERGTRGRKPPVLIPQADSPPHEVLGLGVGEDDPAIHGQQEDGETGGRDRSGEQVRCCPRPGKQLMDRGCSLKMRREGSKMTCRS